MAYKCLQCGCEYEQYQTFQDTNNTSIGNGLCPMCNDTLKKSYASNELMDDIYNNIKHCSKNAALTRALEELFLMQRQLRAMHSKCSEALISIGMIINDEDKP